MSDTPTEFSTVPDGEPSIPKAAARSSEGVVRHQDKQLEPSIITWTPDIVSLDPNSIVEIKFDWKIIPIDTDAAKRAIQQDIEQRRERIARKLEP